MKIRSIARHPNKIPLITKTSQRTQILFKENPSFQKLHLPSLQSVQYSSEVQILYAKEQSVVKVTHHLENF